MGKKRMLKSSSNMVYKLGRETGWIGRRKEYNQLLFIQVKTYTESESDNKEGEGTGEIRRESVCVRERDI